MSQHWGYVSYRYRQLDPGMTSLALANELEWIEFWSGTPIVVFLLGRRWKISRGPSTACESNDPIDRGKRGKDERRESRGADENRDEAEMEGHFPDAVEQPHEKNKRPLSSPVE
ncbi:hypothetical protein VTO42DRAFT_8883 [Malbranchea cinnamomea]